MSHDCSFLSEGEFNTSHMIIAKHIWKYNFVSNNTDNLETKQNEAGNHCPHQVQNYFLRFNTRDDDGEGGLEGMGLGRF
jgi:hypothetical protein